MVWQRQMLAEAEVEGLPIGTGWGSPCSYQDWMGESLLGLDGGTPHQDWMGSPSLGQDGGTPVWTDRQVSKHYLPSYFVRGWYNSACCNLRGYRNQVNHHKWEVEIKQLHVLGVLKTEFLISYAPECVLVRLGV